MIASSLAGCGVKVGGSERLVTWSAAAPLAALVSSAIALSCMPPPQVGGYMDVLPDMSALERLSSLVMLTLPLHLHHYLQRWHPGKEHCYSFLESALPLCQVYVEEAAA